MTDWLRFRLDKASRLLTGENALFERLCDALQAGYSIQTHQTSSTPLTIKKEKQQWLYCETSGSTGKAKIIQRKPKSWIESFEQNASLFALSKTDRYALLGHIGHSLTLYALLEALHHGADIALLQGLGPKTQGLELAEKQISILYATPTQLRLLAQTAAPRSQTEKDTKEPNQSLCPSLRLLMIGGGKLNAKLAQDLKQLFPNARIHEFYGASETSFLTLADESCPIASVGKAYPNVTLQIRAIEPPFQPLPPFETGEIWISSPYLFDGYAEGDSKQTIWQEDFLSIGELGYLDDKGYLYLKGRKNRMVTVADHNVFLQDIEQILLRDRRVEDCAVLAIPDALRGARIIAIIGAADHPTMLDDLRQICQKTLAPPAIPKEFIRLDHLPKLPSGKVDLQALQTWIEAKE